MNPDYWPAFAKQGATVFPRAADVLAKVQSGEFPITNLASQMDAYQIAKSGAPFTIVFPEEGSFLIPLPWIALTKAPHPNAAKLWLDFIFVRAAD